MIFGIKARKVNQKTDLLCKSVFLRFKPLKYISVEVFFCFFELLFRADRPCNGKGTENCDGAAHRVARRRVLIGNEIGTRQKIKEHHAEHAAVDRFTAKRLGKLTAANAFSVAAVPEEHLRIERLDAIRAVVVVKELCRRFAQRFGIAVHDLELNEERHLAVYKREALAERGDGLLRIAEAKCLQLGKRHAFHLGIHAAHALERVVVKDHKLAVGGEVDVVFDGVAAFDRRAEGGEGVFGDIAAMQTAVRDHLALQQGAILVAAKGGCDQVEQEQHKGEKHVQDDHVMPPLSLFLRRRA